MQPHSIDLFVVANLLLVPSEDLYVTADSLIQYSAVLLKQGITERGFSLELMVILSVPVQLCPRTSTS